MLITTVEYTLYKCEVVTQLWGMGGCCCSRGKTLVINLVTVLEMPLHGTVRRLPTHSCNPFNKARAAQLRRHHSQINHHDSASSRILQL